MRVYWLGDKPPTAAQRRAIERGIDRGDIRDGDEIAPGPSRRPNRAPTRAPARETKAQAKERRARVRYTAKQKVKRRRKAVKTAKESKRRVLKEAREQCAADAERLKLWKEQTRIAARQAIATEGERVRDLCRRAKAELKAKADAAIHDAEKALAAEREEAKRWREYHADEKPARKSRRRGVEAIRESDDRVLANIPPELHPIWNRVKSQIRGGGGRSRTEAFLEYVEDNADDVAALQSEIAEQQAEQWLAEQVAAMHAAEPPPEDPAAFSFGALANPRDWRHPSPEDVRILTAEWDRSRDAPEPPAPLDRDGGIHPNDLIPALSWYLRREPRAVAESSLLSKMRKRYGRALDADAVEQALAELEAAGVVSMKERKTKRGYTYNVKPERNPRAGGKRRRRRFKDTRAAYRAFHWGDDPRTMARVALPPTADLYELGKLRRLDYETSKKGERAIWYHDFERPYPTVTATADGELGPILPGGATVEPDGITG